MSNDSKAELLSPASARRSRRLYIHMPVNLVWRLEDQTLISEETETIVVNAHGGLIRVASVPPLGQKVTVKNTRANQTEEAVVVFVGKAVANDGRVVIGVGFTKPNASFSRINSPPENRFIIATAGAFIAVGMQLVPTFFTASRPSARQPTSIPQGPDILGQVSRLQQFITGPYVVLPWLLVMVYLAISRRNQPISWLYALLAGAALPGVIFHFILRWI